ncbi:hypothetical protein FGO68_gene1799 [Halteria grandinella]|uniref:Rhomboid-like protease n=1 Tax=Halteria grandinella TaxID=5974 RepID=A0A8J8NP10_HALGN|nr:hypothetical protein FGO68_gene1799 [Halteria grandinella]
MNPYLPDQQQQQFYAFSPYDSYQQPVVVNTYYPQQPQPIPVANPYINQQHVSQENPYISQQSPVRDSAIPLQQSQPEPQPQPEQQAKQLTALQWILKIVACIFPNFEWKSITFLLAVVCILMYIGTCIARLSLPSVDWWCILYNSGAKFAYDISKRGHIHRLFLPMILHLNTFHLFCNVLSLLMLGFTIEKELVKRYKYIILIFTSQLGGMFFSSVISPYTLCVGESAAGYGIFAAVLVWFYSNWGKLTILRCAYGAYMCISVILSIIFGFFNPYMKVDHWGHIGGFVFGFFTSFILFQTTEDPSTLDAPSAARRKKILVISSVCLFILSAIFLLALFLRPFPLCEEFKCRVCI